MNTTGEESSRGLLRTVHTQKVHLKTAAFTTGSGISVLVGQSPSPQNEQITETARKNSVLVSQKHTRPTLSPRYSRLNSKQAPHPLTPRHVLRNRHVPVSYRTRGCVACLASHGPAVITSVWTRGPHVSDWDEASFWL
jgi:hypothetical protein